MRKQGDKKAIKNIVQRNLRSEKRRNIMLVISIALASFLICFSGLIATSLLEVQKKQIQDTYEAVYMNVSEEKLLKLREETGFERVGQYYIVGDIPSDKTYTAAFFYMDQPMLYMMRNQMSLFSGELPEEEAQIVVCKKWLDKYDKDKKVGDKITLNTEQLSGKYTISGILDMATSGETFPFLISWEKLKNYEDYNEDSSMVYVHVKEKNAEEIKKYCSEIGEINNLPVAFNNRYFRYVNQMISADQLGILGILIGLVLIGSYTVIKSIFQISIINKIQNYGQLRTIGMTQKQIKKIVKKEGRYLGVRGILIGITLAVLCSAIILAKGINIRNYIVCAMITAAICNAAMMCMTEDAFKELLPGIKNFDFTWGINIDPKEQSSVDENLRNTISKNEDIAIESFSERVKGYEKDNTIYFVLQVISILIFLFGVINLINTTLSNQLFRRREYSVLRSIGLTEKQLYKVIIGEGMCYSILSICMTLLIGTPIAMLICRQMSISCYGKVVEYSFPFFYMGIYVLVLLLIQVILSIYQIREQKKKSIIDQLRME